MRSSKGGTQKLTLPKGAKVLLINAASGRDERKYADPDRFDVGRSIDLHLNFEWVVCRTGSSPGDLDLIKSFFYAAVYCLKIGNQTNQFEMSYLWEALPPEIEGLQESG